MPTVAVMNQIVEELSDELTKLKQGYDIYLSPIVIEAPAKRTFTLQVCDGGSAYSDFDGGIKREHFQVTVGVLKVFKVDFEGNFQKALSNLTHSIFVLKEQVSDILEGSYLEVAGTALLVRPLRISSETPIRRGVREKGLLIKELTFIGGMNETRTS